MGKNVIFYLGPAPAAAGLQVRRLVIHEMPKAGKAADWPKDQHPNVYSITNSSGTTEFVDVALPDNRIWQAQLRDYKTTGESSRIDVLNFHTGSLQFPGPKSMDRLQVYAMEDLSSSSASSSSSSSSSSKSSISTSSNSSSKSSESSNSSSSNSSSSKSSISTSSSSKSSISTSSKSSNSSSKSSISTSSSKSSVSSSSASSISSSSASSSSKSSASSSSISGSTGLPA